MRPMRSQMLSRAPGRRVRSLFRPRTRTILPRSALRIQGEGFRKQYAIGYSILFLQRKTSGRERVKGWPSHGLLWWTNMAGLLRWKAKSARERPSRSEERRVGEEGR